ncbi:MAG: hypothetical protein AAF206_28585 [Bacteroidota bacterium]
MMKSQFQKTRLLFLMCLLGILTSCSQQEDFSAAVAENFLDMSESSGEIVLSISFEMEANTRVYVKGADESTHFSKPDRINQVPQITRQKIQMDVKADGSIDLISENMTPSQNIIPDHESLPSNTPMPEKTILRDGMMYLYDGGGNLLAQHPVETPVNDVLIQHIGELKQDHSVETLNEVILSMQSAAYDEELQAMINNPEAYGATIEHLDANIVGLSVPAVNTGISNNDDVSVMVVDIEHNLMLANQLLDGTGKLKVSTMIEYGYEGDSPRLKGILTQMPYVLPSGTAATMETYQAISKLNVHFN